MNKTEIKVKIVKIFKHEIEIQIQHDDFVRIERLSIDDIFTIDIYTPTVIIGTEKPFGGGHVE